MPLARPTLAVAAAVVLLATGCGSSGGGGSTPPAQPPPTAGLQDFPKAAGRTLGELQARLPEGPVLSPSVSLLEPGANRVGFGLFDVAHKPLAGAAAALYVSDPDGSHLRGPFVARSESLVVKPQFESRTTAQDPDSANSVYVADVTFPRKGKYVVVAVARVDGRLLASGATSMEVGPKGAAPPAVGEKAPRVHTPTVASAGGDVSKVTTRVPPDLNLLKTDLADVLGRKPVVLMFATPQLCVSRVCGPVVDIEAQVQAAVGDKVAFIHNEIYNENDTAKGFRPQVRAYRLPTEPWCFVIDRTGRVSARFEGAFSVGELQRAVAKVVAPASS
jgi:hypothetical protein